MVGQPIAPAQPGRSAIVPSAAATVTLLNPDATVDQPYSPVFQVESPGGKTPKIKLKYSNPVGEAPIKIKIQKSGKNFYIVRTDKPLTFSEPGFDVLDLDVNGTVYRQVVTISPS